MMNKAIIILALTFSAGAMSAAQAGEGSIDSDNNVVGTQQYPGNAYGYGYQYSVPDSVIIAPGYATSSEPMIEDDMNTGYAPPDMADDYTDEPSNP
jgi:hypothetical protein